MTTFVGRQHQLAQLDSAYRAARTGTGAFVWMTGRRRVGKSRLLEEFLTRIDAPHVFFQAPRGSNRNGLAEFIDAVASSTLASAATFANVRPENWRGALELAALGTTPEQPAIIVIDEFPYLHEADDGIDAELQHTWDRVLEKLPVVLVCIGSDLAMMDRLVASERPLHGRPTHPIRVPALLPSDVADLTHLAPAEALDAYLVVGGFPLLAHRWRGQTDVHAFLRDELVDESSPLVVNGLRIVGSELPVDAHARAVLDVIGSGQRTYAKILERAQLSTTTMRRAIDLLMEKQIVAKVTPVSVPIQKETHYLVIDPHLRFWLRFIGPYFAELERGRGDLVRERIKRDWTTFAGLSVEPVIREGVNRMLLDAPIAGAREVGSFWNRKSTIEIDLVGVDSLTAPSTVHFAGSIKWRANAPFDAADARALANHRADLPGSTTSTQLVGVSKQGFTDDAAVDVQLGARDIVDAFRA